MNSTDMGMPSGDGGMMPPFLPPNLFAKKNHLHLIWKVVLFLVNLKLIKLLSQLLKGSSP